MEKKLKSNCNKSQFAHKDFSSILLRLHVASLDSPEIIRATASQNTWLLLFVIYYNPLGTVIPIIYQYI